jgi:hypothetical protein
MGLARRDVASRCLTRVARPSGTVTASTPLYDSLVAGLHRERAPLVVERVGAADCPAALVAYLTRVRAVFADAGAALGAQVELRLTPVPPRLRPPTRPRR